MGRMANPDNHDQDRAPLEWARQAEAQVLEEVLALAPERGWTWAVTYAAAGAAGLSRGETELLLPEGPRDLAALWSRRCDAAALGALEAVDPASLKVRERIRRAALARLDAAMTHEAATRRWTGFLALPANAPLGLRLVWESADGLWRWAGDQSTDENHYSKRAILAEVLTGVLLVRLTAGEEAAARRLDRRIAAVMAFERLKAGLRPGEVARMAASALGRVRYVLG
jgi:ubiquinone biosynthesis protein COQ9